MSDLDRRLRIKNIVDETANAKTFVLEPLGWEISAVSGQFLTFSFNTKHGEKRRSYSLSSSPELKEPLQVTVKRIENGEFSRKLFSEVKIGDELTCTGVAGNFTLQHKQSPHYVFIAAGSGITPCYSMIRTLLYKGSAKVSLIYSNRTEADAIFFQSLQNLANEFHDRFFVTFLFSDRRNVYESRLSHWLLPQILRSHKIDKQSLFYLCGPFEYMQMVQITLLSQYKLGQIFREQFDHSPRLILPQPPDDREHKVRILFEGKTYQLNVKYPVSILAEAKKNGINLPYSCEAGRCSACAGTCTSGKIWMAYNEVLTDRETSSGRVLLCQAYPVNGDVTVEVP